MNNKQRNYKIVKIIITLWSILFILNQIFRHLLFFHHFNHDFLFPLLIHYFFLLPNFITIIVVVLEVLLILADHLSNVILLLVVLLFSLFKLLQLLKLNLVLIVLLLMIFQLDQALVFILQWYFHYYRLSPQVLLHFF